MATSTSFRLSAAAKQRLAERAAEEGLSNTALLERLIVEGIDTLEHPGIAYRGPGNDRRAALAGGPDVWEIVARLRELAGSEDERIETLAVECDLHPRQVHIALDFAAQQRHDIEARISRHDNAVAATRIAAEERRALFA